MMLCKCTLQFEMKSFISVGTVLLLTFTYAKGHGRFINPVSRASMWRYKNNEYIAPYASLVEDDYNDNQLFCGGFSHQQSLGGLCGVCGDAWDADVREHEAGGKYAKGIIVDQFSPGSWIDVTIEITVHHKGYFEFRLCQWDNTEVPITHDCLNEHELQTEQGLKWMLPPAGGSQIYDLKVKLPEDVECDQCVIQWKYHTGNNWGCEGGECGTGVGPQEEFYGCADIAIGSGPILIPPEFSGSTTPSASKTTTEASTTTSTTTMSATSTATTFTTTVGLPVTTDTVDGTNPCPAAGSGLQKYDCTSYYQCAGSEQVVQQCPPGTAFNEVTRICDHPYNVPSPCGTKE